MIKSLLIVVLGFIGCKTAGDSTSRLRLIGGQEAEPNEFPATIQFGSCTGVKIAAKTFLTAAHCIVNKEKKRLSYQTGDSLALFYGPRLASATKFSVTITGIAVHKAYFEAMQDNPRQEVYKDAPDIGAFSVAEETPTIRVAAIDYESVTPADEIIVGGYGCETPPPGFGGTPDFGSPGGGIITSGETGVRLKWAKTKVGDVGAVFATFRDETNVFGEPVLKLCPGDSGGPVFSSDHEVIGINSHGGLADSAFVRLDDETRFELGACLRDLVQRGLNQPDPTPTNLCED